MEINKRIEQSERSHIVSSYGKIKQSDILRDRAEVSNLNLGFKLETTFFVSFTPVVSAFMLLNL